jgi:hypothetical protein
MKTSLIFLTIFCIACQSDVKNTASKPLAVKTQIATKSLIQENGKTIAERFLPPRDYQRTKVSENSFAHYLRNLKLKPAGSEVRFHNGGIKPNQNVYDAVVDLEIGTKNLHQCADAIMRLKAEYLWDQKKYDQIHFNFTNGMRVDYSEWMKGKRITIDGNKTSWVNKTNPGNTYDDFWNYLEVIFMYAGTASLEKELKPVKISDAIIGDVLIQGGHPGHAVIILDKATNSTTGKNVYLLAQSYMPAQEIQVLKNSMDVELSPWYEITERYIETPEWSFERGDLKRFGE